MRLIHCRKCGAALVTEDALIERMNDTIHELNEKARHSKNGKIAKSYLAEAASVTKMMKGILHNTASMEARKSGNNIRVTNQEREELRTYRNNLQRQAILDCNNLLALIGLARPLFHLKGKKVKYWSEKVIKTRNYIKRWRESDQKRYL